MTLPEPINTFLNQIKTAIYGREVRSSIVGAIEQCYEDAGNLAEVNTQAAGKANTATANANRAADRADVAADVANTAATNADASAGNAELTRQDLLNRVKNGEFKGEQGDKGDTGKQGASGVMAPSAGMFSLFLDSSTGNLYADYPDGETPPAFEYDKDTGSLYYVTG